MSMSSERIDEFLESPTAAAMFVHAHRLRLNPEALADPTTTSLVLSSALGRLNPWHGAPATARADALRKVQPLRHFVEEVLLDPRNLWWFGSLDRKRQILLSSADGETIDPLKVLDINSVPPRYDDYSQAPWEVGLRTSTDISIDPTKEPFSGAHAELACGVSDWSPDFPISQTQVLVSSAARIYEVNSAMDWHRLVVERSAPNAPASDSDDNLKDSAGILHGPAPHWPSVGKEFDGVHLSFAGLLTALYVPVTTDAVTTTLWAWAWESTWWLRASFDDIRDLGPLMDRPDDRDYNQAEDDDPMT